jgi:hypothetical protein
MSKSKSLIGKKYGTCYISFKNYTTIYTLIFHVMPVFYANLFQYHLCTWLYIIRYIIVIIMDICNYVVVFISVHGHGQI